MQDVLTSVRERDFSGRKSFPGTIGSGLLGFERHAGWVNDVPAPAFAVALLLLAVVPAWGRLAVGLTTWAFFLGDWALLAALPRAGRSFGPSQSSVIVLALLRLPAILLPTPLWFVLEATGTLLVFYSFWIEPQRLTLTRQSLKSEKLKAGAPLRILHLSDLHMERITGRDLRLVSLARELAPDLIVISGDFLNVSYIYDWRARQDACTILSQLSAPLGVYAVLGSPAADRDGVVPEIFAGLDIRFMRNEKVTITRGEQEFQLVGVDCTHKPFVDGPRLAEALGEQRDLFTLLLYHTPDLAPEAAELGVDLQLSGHTHGGQVRLPLFGALYAGSLYGKLFESGLRRLGEMTLYVSRGLGLEGESAPRVRFLCPPEVILWQIEGTANA